jgi:hypothetical protein
MEQCDRNREHKDNSGGTQHIGDAGVDPEHHPGLVYGEHFGPYDQTSELEGYPYPRTLGMTSDQHSLTAESDIPSPYQAQAIRQPSRQHPSVAYESRSDPWSAMDSNVRNSGPGLDWDEGGLLWATASNNLSQHSMPSYITAFSRYPAHQPLLVKCPPDACAGPWSPYTPAIPHQALGCSYESASVGWQEPSDTARSTDESYGSYEMIGNSTPSTLSRDPSDSGMVDSTLTERPYHLRFQQFPQGQTPTQHLSQYNPRFDLRSASPQVNSGPRPPTQYESGHLAPPMQRKVSSTSSCASEGSSLTPDTPDVLYCNESGCATLFTGKYRKGNLARHKRLIHKHHEPYVCEGYGCRKSFKRQDARLKHYRRHHPHLAGPCMPRSPHARRPVGNQDDDLRNISSWTETASGSATGEKSFNAP